MKKIFFSLLVFFISASVFAGGWFQDFSSGRPAIYADESQASDSEWYITGAASPVNVTSLWKTAWTLESSLKPAGSFLYLDGTLPPVFGIAEFSLVSPAFTPTANTAAVDYRIQEIKIFDYDEVEAEELYLEVATKVEGTWTWVTSSINILGSLTGYDTETTAITDLQKSLSDYIGQEIKIRFRGKVAEGNFVAVLYHVALTDNSVTDLGVIAPQNILTQIPKKHANQALSASVQNFGGAVATDAATVTAKIAGSETTIATANVPALATLEKAALTFAAPFVPQSFGEYRLQYSLPDDTNASNNTATSNAFTITPNTFATDKGWLLAVTGAQNIDYGNKFTLLEKDKIESVSVAWGKSYSSPDTHEFQLVIYALDANGVLNTTPVYTSAVLTRPDNAATLGNNRAAIFNTYPVAPDSLPAGAYIFAVRSLATNGINIGVEESAGGVYYGINNTNDQLTTTRDHNLLIRVNTASDITLSPAVGSQAAGITEPIVIAGSAVTGLAASPTITIKKADNAAVTSISATYTDNAITITHAALEYNTAYTVTVPANTIIGYASELSWSFTTATGPLTASVFLPARNATTVALGTTVSVTFNRVIPEGSSLTGITIATDSVEPIAVSGVSATKDNNVLTIAHDAFEKGKKYKVTIPATAINELAADTSWVFTTIPPLGLATTSTFYPANNATDVPLNIASIWVNFNQALDISSTLAGITINGTPVSASFGYNAGITNSRITISTAGVTFEENTPYTVVVPAGAIAGYNQEISWSFTSFVTLAPVAYTPAKGEQGVFLGTEISIEFNKKEFYPTGLSPTGQVSITAGGTALEGVTYAKDENRKKLVISHPALLPNTEYTINVTANAIPFYDGVSDWTFTTESAPEIVKFTPVDGAVNVAIGNTVEVTFNQAIDTASTAGISINGAAPRSVSIQSGRTALRLVHEPFTHATEYTVTIPAGSVLGYGRDTSWTFTTVPVLTYTTSPANDAIGVTLNAPLKIEFDRAPVRPRNGFADISIEGDNGENIEVINSSWNTAGDTITITHAPFDPDVIYTVNVGATSIIDAADWTSNESSIIWSFTTTDGSGLQKLSATSGVYPALTKGDITVISDPGSLIKIVDIAGAVRATYRSVSKQTPIYLKGASGLYLVVIENGKSTSVYKVVLQK